LLSVPVSFLLPTDTYRYLPRTEISAQPLKKKTTPGSFHLNSGMI
jgi:hypothetical protein